MLFWLQGCRLARTTNTQRELFSKIPNFWAWADKLGRKFLGHLGIFGRFISNHFGTVSSLSMFSINQPLSLQKTKPLYPNPKKIFGSGSWIWARKNYEFSHRVSVVRASGLVIWYSRNILVIQTTYWFWISNIPAFRYFSLVEIILFVTRILKTMFLYSKVY